MGLTTSHRGGSASINVTPLIDVLLVLLIIFMVIQPTFQHGLAALAPNPPETRDTDPDPRALVVSIDDTASSPTYSLNGQPLSSAQLGAELQSRSQQSAPQALFVRGAAELDYGSVISVIDISHAAGFESVGILTPATTAP